ncbi:unnamed protein product, partial [Brassica oleracea var. botrytis]
SFRALALPARSFNYLPHSLKRSSIRMENPTFSSEASAKPRGAFIVVEGLDRSGKSTQCAKLRSFFESSGHLTELWRFPDRETSVGQMISALSLTVLVRSLREELRLSLIVIPTLVWLSHQLKVLGSSGARRRKLDCWLRILCFTLTYHLRELLREVDMEMRGTNVECRM